MVRPTDGPKDGQTDRWTNTARYRDVCWKLEIGIRQGDGQLERLIKRKSHIDRH